MIEDPTGLAALFLKYDYTETKDLAKSLLTLASSTLVFSVTFSEKIIDFRNARKSERVAMMLSWSSNVISISSCGLAIALISYSGRQAAYGGDYELTAVYFHSLLLFSGFMFVVSLIFIVVSAMISMMTAPRGVNRTLRND